MAPAVEAIAKATCVHSEPLQFLPIAVSSTSAPPAILQAEAGMEIEIDESTMEAMAEFFLEDVHDEEPEARAERVATAKAMVKRDRKRIMGIVAKGAKVKKLNVAS